MTYTFKGKVVRHELQKDDSVFSEVEVRKTSSIFTQKIEVPLKFPLAAEVYITVSDTEPEGGAA